MRTSIQRALLTSALILAICTGGVSSALAQSASHSVQPAQTDRYTPIPGGWQLQIDKATDAGRQANSAKFVDSTTGRLKPAAPIGWLKDDPRTHRTLLFPPADKTMIWTPEEIEKTPRVLFRPLVVAYNAPRFLFDYHSAGGLLGHLVIGIVPDGQPGLWLHDCSRIDIRYVNGRVKYELRDDRLGNAVVRLVATPQAYSAGLIVLVAVEGAAKGSTLVWAYGGASGFFTNYNMDAREFKFSPEQCAKDKYTLDNGIFELTRAFDKSDEIVSGGGQSLCVMRSLPKWKAHVRSGSSWKQAVSGFGDPKAFNESPAKLLAATRWNTASADNTPAASENCVAVQKVALAEHPGPGFIVVGMGGKINDAIAQPAYLFGIAQGRNDDIARRIGSHTPDPYLDSAMTMMSLATDGTWASEAYVHGGWSWRFAYLGWRIMYGPTCCGWTDNVRRAIQSHCRLGPLTKGPDKGAIGSMLEGQGFFYNMDEVFLDMVRHYWEYTGDVELMKEIFPVLEGAIERENRRLRPGPEPLYESALNTWISDSHWYIRGQCTQASAYMLGAYEFMADVADKLGRNPIPFRKQADDIRAAMNKVLWQKREGIFAEYLDTRGHKLLHGEPELPTLYHAAEFGAADPLQIYQMLHWADTHLRQEHTPGNGILYWSSNWFPNAGRSYTHSTYEMAYGEELNFAETNYLAGRNDIGYGLIRASLSGIFNGLTPGQLSCHAYTDGTQRMNEAFADATSMFVRAACEGLFGIQVDRPRYAIKLKPQPPEDWPEMSITTPSISYKLKRQINGIQLTWQTLNLTTIQLSLPVRAIRVTQVQLDGQPLVYKTRPGVGLTWIDAQISASRGGTVDVIYIADTMKPLPTISATLGQSCTIALPSGAVGDWQDPQGLLADAKAEGKTLTGKIVGQPGSGVLFIADKAAESPKWIPVAVDIKAEKPAPARQWSKPDVPDRNVDRWQLIDLAGVYNASVPEVPKRLKTGAIAPAMPADQVGFGYWLEHVTVRSKPPCDTAWRAKIGADGVAWTTDGVPFKSRREGANIACVAMLNREFPASVSFPVDAGGRTLYLMISGMTHPAQSHVTNVRITLTYADGSRETHDMVNPFDIGDCWSTWLGTYFDTAANGFENIGGRSGPAGRSKVPDLTRPPAVDTIAHLVALPLSTGKQLQRIEMEAIANDAVFGIMGASILK